MGVRGIGECIRYWNRVCLRAGPSAPAARCAPVRGLVPPRPCLDAPLRRGSLRPRSARARGAPPAPPPCRAVPVPGSWVLCCGELRRAPPPAGRRRPPGAAARRAPPSGPAAPARGPVRLTGPAAPAWAVWPRWVVPRGSRGWGRPVGVMVTHCQRRAARGGFAAERASGQGIPTPRCRDRHLAQPHLHRVNGCEAGVPAPCVGGRA
mgnify:CR=1 FL=1